MKYLVLSAIALASAASTAQAAFINIFEGANQSSIPTIVYGGVVVNYVKTWVRQTKKRYFIYTVKVCELITHIKRFSRTQMLVKDFEFIAELLGPRMGCFLFQLPPSFHYTPARLKNVLSQMNSSLRNVVEFRHGSW